MLKIDLIRRGCSQITTPDKGAWCRDRKLKIGKTALNLYELVHVYIHNATKPKRVYFRRTAFIMLLLDRSQRCGQRRQPLQHDSGVFRLLLRRSGHNFLDEFWKKTRQQHGVKQNNRDDVCSL